MSADCGIGAFFDLDGTLLAPPSAERRFIRYLLRRRLLRVSSLVGWLVDVLENAPIGAPFAEADRFYLRGLNSSLAEEWLAEFGGAVPFFREAVDAIEWHAARSHHVVIVSGTLAPLARALVRRLPGGVTVCATELKTEKCAAGADFGTSFWTGQLSGELLNGAAKARAVRAVAVRYELDLSRSFAYGDSASDIRMLAAVGNPCAVNAGFGLRRVARACGWRMERWHTAVRADGHCVASGVGAARLGSER